MKNLFIILKGAGEMATGVAGRLYRANFRRILMLEVPSPLAIRRRVCFSEAIYDRTMTVEGIKAVRVSGEAELKAAWEADNIAVRVDPGGESIRACKPDVLIDAVLAKQNLGISSADAFLVIALGPGFTAGRDCHIVIESKRGHDLGRLITAGTAAANSGIPGDICGYTRERVLRAPAGGVFNSRRRIGDLVRKGESVGSVGPAEVSAEIDGMLRGLIRDGSLVTRGLKVGDIDPRGETAAFYCDTISDKARALGGAVLEAILSVYNQCDTDLRSR